MAAAAPAATPSPASSLLSKDEIARTSADFYFDSNSHFGVHEELLKDRSRMKVWKKVINENNHLFKGKKILDLGTGTGILAMMAVKQGAEKVYAVESAEIIHLAEKIIEVNKMSDKIVCIKGKIEDIPLTSIPEKVDLILCDWMGYFLFQESMLESVLYARDHFLKSDGILLPDRASLFIAAIEDEEYRSEKIDWWGDVYGFKMTIVKGLAVTEPLVDNCPANQLISSIGKLFDIDLKTVKKEDVLKFSSTYDLTITQENSCHALVVYWEAQFSSTHTKVILSTSPKVETTHWKQTVFYLDEAVDRLKVNQHLKGKFDIQRNEKNQKELDVTISCQVGQKNQERTYHFR